MVHIVEKFGLFCVMDDNHSIIANCRDKFTAESILNKYKKVLEWTPSNIRF